MCENENKTRIDRQVSESDRLDEDLSLKSAITLATRCAGTH